MAFVRFVVRWNLGKTLNSVVKSIFFSSSLLFVPISLRRDAGKIGGETSAKSIADFQINLFGKFRCANFGTFAAHSLYSERGAVECDGDFFRADASHLSGWCQTISCL
jgi:hypothetical protein